MFPQRRMTTDTPDGNYSQALNLFVRGEDGWVQMPSRSISLNDYMKQLIKAHNADIDTEGTPEEFDMTLCEHLFDGPETIEGLLAEHYTLSWALASLRDKLKHYEDAGIPEIMPGGLQTIDRAIENLRQGRPAHQSCGGDVGTHQSPLQVQRVPAQVRQPAQSEAAGSVLEHRGGNCRRFHYAGTVARIFQRARECQHYENRMGQARPAQG